MNTTGKKTILASFREWMLKRGILYGLISTPMIALFVGYFYRFTDFPTANAFTVILAFAVLPVWVVVRRKSSDDPEEPVHHLHKYALWALVPYVIYNFARIPMHYLLQIVFWDHWYDYGYELTGLPVDQWASLIPGTLLHSLQGYVLALGFYILFKEYSLRNALAYVWIFLSTIYTWTFPNFVLVDFQPPLAWFVVVWWAHFWMAIAAWYVPKAIASQKFRSLFRSRLSRAFTSIVLALLYFTPVLFVFWRVATWQFRFQDSIDQANFQKVTLVLYEGLTQKSVDPTTGEALYEFVLRFGPRSYKDYIQATKAVDAGPIRASGRILDQGNVVGFCWTHVDMLETPNNILVPADYFSTLQRMEYTDIPVQCRSTAAAAESLERNGQAQLEWTADVILVGDRGKQQQHYGGKWVTGGAVSSQVGAGNQVAGEGQGAAPR